MENSFMHFHDIQSEYERNNRSNGMKALRCFPRCRETGHCKSGFCGTSLKCSMEIQVNEKSPPCQLDDNFWMSCTYIAEMRESLVPGLSSVRFISRKDIDSQLRSRPEKFKSLIEGRINSIKSEVKSKGSVTKTVNIEFNAQCQAWHYGWHSHKYKKNTKHCVDVLVLIENGFDGYFIAASFLSPEFEIVSTKTVQKKIGLVDEATSQAFRLSQKDRGSASIDLISGKKRSNKRCREETSTPEVENSKHKGDVEEEYESDSGCTQSTPEILASLRTANVSDL